MKVKILLGPICSGKTMYSQYLQKEHGYIRFSQDELRRMVFGKLENDSQKDEYIAYLIYNAVLAWSGPQHNGDKIVIDGFPLSLRHLGYILNGFDSDVLLFRVDLSVANMRNLKRRSNGGVFINPEEIRRYDTLFKNFTRSAGFQNVIHRSKAHVIDMSKIETAS